MKELLEYLKYSGPSTLIILTGLVFGKSLIKYFFEETIELKKDDLKQHLEKYKSSIEQNNKDFQHLLDIKLNTFNIRFSELHQERAKVIKELYFKLLELQSSMYDFTRRAHVVIEDAEKEEQERADRVNKAIKEFNNYYLPNKIFFSRKLAEKLDNLSKEYWNKGSEFSSFMGHFKNMLPGGSAQDIFVKIKQISDFIEKDIVELIEDIENEFRGILGVE
ncbi:hypothetical protein KBJ98_04360 [Flavobacterium sp. F-328]|uniref:Uncharacterized protein n=1 Tax=Flavobacterium erciyesense TaxID=2825842 RepID=A0ABS5D1M8_9FLAO|nr:hypothetical protein [Flavobacterium erciyesense]MBQ0907931.1 hypothetical protein [Flavobacterium erciyesense]